MTVPAPLPTRALALGDFHRGRGAGIGVDGDRETVAAGVRPGLAAAGLIVADLSGLPRRGLAGPATAERLLATGCAIPAMPLTAALQADGSLLCRLLGTSHLALARPGGAEPAALAAAIDQDCWDTGEDEAAVDLLIAGTEARRLFSHLTAFDLRERAFPDLSLAFTNVLGLNVLLIRWDLEGRPAYRLLVDAAIAPAFAEELTRLLAVTGGSWLGAPLPADGMPQ